MKTEQQKVGKLSPAAVQAVARAEASAQAWLAGLAGTPMSWVAA